MFTEIYNTIGSRALYGAFKGFGMQGPLPKRLLIKLVHIKNTAELALNVICFEQLLPITAIFRYNAALYS